MNLIQSVDALLPQTQCGKCGHPGCMPYAEGITRGEAINKCPPGGDETIIALAQLLGVPALPLDQERGPAPAQVAFIREAECIGCTKCIQACPVDAIVGAAKLMHTVIIDECTGCDLCVAPCPVDCIDMLPVSADQERLVNIAPLVGGLASTADQQEARRRKRGHARLRFESRNARLRLDEERRLAERRARAQTPSAAPSKPQSVPEPGAWQPGASNDTINGVELTQARAAMAMSRAQLNKSLKAFGHPPTAEQAAQLAELQHEFEIAEQALAQLLREQPTDSQSPPAQVDSAQNKRAKIHLAMAKAALMKAQSTHALPQPIAERSATLHRAKQGITESSPPIANPRETLGS